MSADTESSNKKDRATVEHARSDYEREGFLAPMDVFPAAEMNEYREQCNELVAQVGHEASRDGLNARHFDVEFIWELATDSRVLDWVEAVMGPDIVILDSLFFCQYPSSEVEHYVAWHQDVTYWGLEPAEALSAWIAIDDADAENGCMEVIPGSHQVGMVPHVTAATPGNILSVGQEIPDEYVDRSSAFLVELDAGQMSFHHGKLFHSSPPTRSDRRSCGLVIRYISPHVKQVEPHSLEGFYRTVLVRGDDTNGLHSVHHPPFLLT